MAKQTVSLTVKQKAGVTINATWLLNIGRIETVTAQGTDAVIEYRESPTELHVLLVDETKSYVDLRTQGYDDTTYTSLNVLDIDGVAVNAARTFAISGLIYAFADPLTSAHSIIVYSEDGGDTNNVRVNYTLSALQALLIPTVDESGTLLSFGTYGDYRVLSNASGDSVPIQVALESQTNATVADTSFLGLYVSVKNTTAHQGNNKMQGILSSTKLNKNCFDAYGVQGHVSVDTGMSTLNANAHITGISGKAVLTGAVGQGWVTGGLFILDGAAAVTGLCHGVAIVAEVGVTATDAMLYITNSGNSTVGIDLQGGYTTAVNIPGTYTTGMSLAGTCTTGVAFTGTVTTGVDFTSCTIAPDVNRTNSAIAIGDRLGAKTITMTAGGVAKNLDPIQMNLSIVGADPAATSTINGIYQNITHTTTDMASLRLKAADWNVVVGKNVMDVYCYQGEVDFTGNSTISGEAAGFGMTVNASAGTIAGNIWGGIIVMDGASMPSTTSAGLLISGRTNITHGLYIEPVTTKTITNGVYMNVPGAITNAMNINGAANVTNLFTFDAAAGCVGVTSAGNAGFVSNNLGTLTLVGFAKILIGVNTYYMPYGTIA